MACLLPANDQPPPPAEAREETHLQGVIASLALWLALVGYCLIFRATMIGSFREEMGPGVSLFQMWRCFLTGFRFDASIVTYLCLPLAVLSLVGFFKPLPRLHRATRGWLAAMATTILCLTFVADLAYFKEYHNQFDHWIWGLVFDDRGAIALTIWKSYPVVWLLLGVIVVGYLMQWLAARWMAWAARRCPPIKLGINSGWGVALLVLLTGAVVVGLRGSWGRRPVQMKDAAVCNNRFLDKLVPNPLSALRYAVTQRLALLRAVGLETILPGGDVRGAARALSPHTDPDAPLESYLRRTAVGRPGAPPEHVYVVVMESYDSWAMQPKFRSLHLTDRLAALGRAGVMAEGFVSAGDGTMPSLATLISGLPEVGVQTNYRELVRKGVATASAEIFKRLGYRTRFFYGGYLSWQRLGEFCREQGFDEVYGGAGMAAGLTGNEWGVDDRVLFRFVLDHTSEQRTFDVIMTTSYHPPFSVNLGAEGFPLTAMPADLAQYRVNEQELRVLGHLWYSDRCLGEFAEQAVRQFPLALMAFTGDHWSRRCLDTPPSLFERKAVPFVLYGPSVLTNVARPEHIVGSHLDIVPTLIELSAPTNFVYHAFGRNLLDASRPQLGFGCGTVISPGFIFEVDCPNRWESLAGEPLPSVAPAELGLRYRQIHGLAWWRIMKGNALPASPEPAGAFPRLTCAGPP